MDESDDAGQAKIGAASAQGQGETVVDTGQGAEAAETTPNKAKKIDAGAINEQEPRNQGLRIVAQVGRSEREMAPFGVVGRMLCGMHTLGLDGS
jgi:hypothetical protein